jgi:hypothetical protein
MAGATNAGSLASSSEPGGSEPGSSEPGSVEPTWGADEKTVSATGISRELEFDCDSFVSSKLDFHSKKIQ